MIDLLNRRFVTYFVNTGGPGLGRNTKASRFLVDQPGHKQAFLKAFAPDGTFLAASGIYADKDAVFTFLKGVLDAHPELARATPEEDRVLSAGGLAAASLLEELGRYDEAVRLYASCEGPEAVLARARVARYRKEWVSQNETLAALRERPEFAADVAVEDGYRLLAHKDYAAARRLLQAAAKAHEASPRSAELHFYAGVACWFAGDKDWARFHWGWIIDNREADRLYRRAYIAAADEAMPYPNAELGRTGIRPYPKHVGIPMILDAVARAIRDHDKMLPLYRAGDLTGRMRPLPEGDETPAELAAQLKDGPEYRLRNNKLVRRLIASGKPSVDALVAALGQDGFRGRGYAAFALAHAMRATEHRPAAALRALEAATNDADPYVADFARTGMKALSGNR